MERDTSGKERGAFVSTFLFEKRFWESDSESPLHMQTSGKTCL